MRNVLAPHLKSGRIALMDNLSVHKSGWVREILEEKDCRLWLLPSYSPDLNSIEEAFSKVKTFAKEAEGQDPKGSIRSHGGHFEQ
jgi:putative transposase